MNECHMNSTVEEYYVEICTTFFILYYNNAPSLTVQEKYLLYKKAYGSFY
jgi:hypothetical protein